VPPSSGRRQGRGSVSVKASLATVRPKLEPSEAAAAAAAARLSVAELAALLQEKYRDSSSAARQHMLPLRLLAKLLHGKYVDADSLQVSELLQQTHLLLQYLQQRTSGVQSNAAEPPWPPLTAARHVQSLQRLVEVSEVQQQLGSQQLRQLVAMLSLAAQQLAGAGHLQVDALVVTDTARITSRGPTKRTGRRQPASATRSRFRAAAAAAAVEAGAPPGTATVGAAATAAAGAEDAGASADAAVASPPTVQSLTLAQLQQVLQSRGKESRWFVPQTASVNQLTPLRALAQLLHGADFAADQVQAAGLLRQWQRLQQHLEDRVAGSAAGEDPLKPNTAAGHCQSVLQSCRSCLLLWRQQGRGSNPTGAAGGVAIRQAMRHKMRLQQQEQCRQQQQQDLLKTVALDLDQGRALSPLLLPALQQQQQHLQEQQHHRQRQVLLMSVTLNSSGLNLQLVPALLHEQQHHRQRQALLMALALNLQLLPALRQQDLHAHQRRHHQWQHQQQHQQQSHQPQAPLRPLVLTPAPHLLLALRQ